MIQKKMLNLGNNGCLLFCYLYLSNIETMTAYYLLEPFIQAGVVDSECTVLNPEKLYSMFGIKASVIISNENPGKTCIARFNNGKFSHFVVVDKNNNVIFDPLGDSNTVRTGTIKDYRVVDFRA